MGYQREALRCALCDIKIFEIYRTNLNIYSYFKVIAGWLIRICTTFTRPFLAARWRAVAPWLWWLTSRSIRSARSWITWTLFFCMANWRGDHPSLVERFISAFSFINELTISWWPKKQAWWKAFHPESRVSFIRSQMFVLLWLRGISWRVPWVDSEDLS